jgi:hypothetical protein
MNKKKVIVKYATQSYDPRPPRKYEIEIPSNGNIAQDRETTFRYMNTVDGSEIENQLKALKERSMSVGDSVIIDGREFLCMMAGWKELTELEVKQ